MLKKIADVVALGGAIIGSTLIALNIGVAVVGYLFFLLSAIAAVYLLKTTKGPGSLLLLNLFFVGVNLFGLIRHF